MKPSRWTAAVALVALACAQPASKVAEEPTTAATEPATTAAAAPGATQPSTRPAAEITRAVEKVDVVFYYLPG